MKRTVMSPAILHSPLFRYTTILILVGLAFLFSCTAHNKSVARVNAGLLRQEVSPSQQKVSIASGAQPEIGNLGDHYLMLVNTALASKMDAQKLSQFDRSPYDGIAVSFADAYDPSPMPSASTMQSQMATWEKRTKKQIWPWVYLNRMIGVNESEGNAVANVPYFRRFQGLDLDNAAGAQKDFFDDWRSALRLARDTGVPGIVCDLEFYNNYKAYDMAELAHMRGVSIPEAVLLLQRLGARMADSAAEEYPGANLWFFFTGFTRPDYRTIDGQPYFLAATYIAGGLLDRIQEKHLRLHVLSGGEVGLGYCHTSEQDLRQAIAKRQAVFDPLLTEYRGILELAGTVTLWSDRSAKKNWVANGACGQSSAETVEDLEPYMQILFKAYRYNWIYGSPNAGYLAFQPDTAPRFDNAIVQAMKNAYR